MQMETMIIVELMFFLLAEIRQLLKWADGKAVKNEVDLQVNYFVVFFIYAIVNTEKVNVFLMTSIILIGILLLDCGQSL